MLCEMAKRPIRADDLNRFIYVGDPQMSPSGERVLFAKKTITEKNAYLTHLCTVDFHGHIVQWTQGEKSASFGRWSPDGSWISFVSGREGPSAQIFLLPTSGGEGTKLTQLPQGSIGDMRWSPDGSKIAFTFREEIPERTEKAAEERKAKGLSEPPLAFDTVWYRLDGDGYFANQRHQLWVLDVAEALRTKGDPEACIICKYTADAVGDYSFDWSPNSKELAVIHNVSKTPYIDPPNKQIWRVGMDGQAWKLEGLPKGEKSTPRWSPDGKSLAYAGDVDEKDPWGTRNTKVYLVPADGGKAKDLTGAQDYDMEVATLSDSKEAAFGAIMEWAADVSGLYVQIGWHGEQQLGFVSLKDGVKLLTEGHHVLSMGNVSKGRVAGTLTTATRLGEVVVIEKELATDHMVPRTLTDLNHEFHAEVQIVEPEEIQFPGIQEVDVHGWVLKPVGFLEPKRYPAVLEVHGGPHTQYGWAFFHEMQVLAAAGYVVVYTNPRGSKGYGEEWTAAIRGDWGNKDWEDIQSVMRWMQHQKFIHPGRMAVMGGSYGGYMTNWTIGHSPDFKCAITDRCVSNMVSMAGNSDFPFNKDGYFRGVAWGSLEDIKELWKQSPISFFQNVKTPTLIIHSAGDLRCNIEQGEECSPRCKCRG